MNYPKISVITVCYNSEKDIEKTMRSVLQQTFHDMEYVIMDGGSEDKTLEIVETVQRAYQDKKVKVFSSPDNGIYDAMNKAVSIACGEWLNFMNSGDVFAHQNILQDIVSSGLMEKSSFIYSDFIADNGKRQRLVPQGYDKGKILHQSSLYKKNLHDSYGLYYVTHPYIVSDYLFFLQVPKENFAKFSQPISVNDTNGVSMQGNWMEYERISADLMMHRIKENTFVFKVIQRYIYNIAKRILGM